MGLKSNVLNCVFSFFFSFSCFCLSLLSQGFTMNFVALTLTLLLVVGEYSSIMLSQSKNTQTIGQSPLCMLTCYNVSKPCKPLLDIYICICIICSKMCRILPVPRSWVQLIMYNVWLQCSGDFCGAQFTVWLIQCWVDSAPQTIHQDYSSTMAFLNRAQFTSLTPP